MFINEMVLFFKVYGYTQYRSYIKEGLRTYDNT